jgi:hypothetical protein
MKIACQSCHTETGWRPIRPAPEFNHNETRFPLRGMHTTVACRQCHVKMVFTDVGKNCADCHADIHRRQMGGNCEECHSVRGWQVSSSSIKQHSNRFPLLGAHAAVECEACHKNAAAGRFVGLSTACSSCHLRDYLTTKVLDHQAAKLPTQCDQCHRMDSWSGAKFDHAQYAGFALVGAHAQLDCVQCHVGNRFAGTSADCFSCHVKDFTSVKDPNHVTAGFSHNCQTCHNMNSWANALFDHNAMTKFPLTGAHATVACAQCHVAGRFAGTPTDCYGCHVKDFESARDPNHMTSHFPTDCAGCHTTATWLGAKFDHNLSKFPLTGAHTSVACTDCHLSGVPFASAPLACQGCHLKDFNSATNPNHAAAGFPLDCTVCHTTVQWKGATFNHNTSTKFPLTGAHVSLGCADCHKNNVYAGLSTACVSCHMADFTGAKNPNHAAAGFPQDCTICHNTTQWMGAKFDHTTMTKFPLTGAHVPLLCSDCHKNNVFAGLATACVSCHMADWNGTNNPNHAAAAFPQTCDVCHSTTTWQNAAFDHNKTKFPLTGAHKTVDCKGCHVNNQFATLSTACVSCHLADFNGTKSPNHAAAGFPQDCTVCHNTTQWMGAKFDHTTMTKFPLTGAHVTVACNTCHKNGVFAGLSTACISCHLADFNGTSNPNHTAAGFPQDCSLCHSTTNWTSATFNHTTQTKFPLTGVHTTVACSACHKSGVYAGLSTACYSCHAAEYAGTTNPNHAAAGFPQDCSLCHAVVAGWAGATFNHSTATRFPLTGAHVTVACSTCHKGGVYAGLSTACYSCHAAEYAGTTNPNHAAAGFPQDCSLCHSTTNWTSATFDHSTATKFPLTGVHKTVACSACHKGGVYAGLSTACYSCHAAEYAGTTNPNHAAAGFPQDCSLCHSTTNWTSATFDHTTQTKFPLTGVHATVACSTCHKGGVYAGLSTACYSCHAADYAGTTNPNHAAAGFPQDCSICHAVVAGWAGAVFDHSKTPFPLTGAHVSVACASCHISGVYVGTPTDCYSCHSAEYKSTTNPNHTAAGFPTTCATCHTTTAWTGATFSHTWFPTNHGRAQGVCSTCHTNPSDYSVFVCTNCHTQTQTDGSHRGVRGYVYSSANCYACHPRGSGG